MKSKKVIVGGFFEIFASINCESTSLGIVKAQTKEMALYKFKLLNKKLNRKKYLIFAEEIIAIDLDI